MSIRKTFAALEQLTAALVNTYLNPETSVTVPSRMSTNSVTLGTAAATSVQTTVTFPAGRFDVAPMVQVSLLGSPGGSQNYVPRVVSRTASQVVIGVWNTTGNITVAPTVMWTAVQMTGGTAEG